MEISKFLGKAFEEEPRALAMATNHKTNKVMDYWHIQMYLPYGKGIDSKQMLQEPKPIIGTGEWDDLQCRYFKGEQGGLDKGSIVLVRRGNEPLALVKVLSDYFTDEELEVNTSFDFTDM